MRKILTILILFCAAVAFAQTPMPNGFRLGTGVTENTTTDSIRVVTINASGISKVIHKDSLVSWLDIPVPEQYFVEITEGTHPGYVHKYRADNPDNYGNIGNQAIDLSYSTAASSIMGALGGRSFLTGVNNRTSTSGYISVIIGGENNHVHGVKQNIIGGTDNTNVSSAAQNSVILGGNNNMISGSSGSNSVILGGNNNLTWASESFLMGVGNIGRNSGETLLGRYSTDYTPTGKNSLRLFNIGFGDNASSRKDLFSILRSGKVGIGYNLFNPPNDSELLQVNGSVLIENTLKLNDYGDGNITGTATKLLAVDADGNVIEEDLPSGGSSITIGTDRQIPFTNSSNDNFEYSDNFKLTEYGVLKLENTWLGGGALSLEDGNKLGQITPDYIRIGDDSGSNPYFNITSTGDMFFRRNNIGTYPSLRLTNAGTGDAGIGFLAGSRGVTMGIDNSDGDLFKISVGSSIPNVGAGTVILEADSNQIKLPIYGSGTITGTATKLLAVDADGKVIEEDLPSGTSLTVTDDDSVSVSNVETINFVGATVTDNLDGSVDVEYSGGTPGGADTQLQFNNDGEFGGISTITTDGTGLAITTNDTSTTPRFSITNNGTGDASMSFKAGTPTYTMGVDNSTSDKFVISRSGALGTSNVLEIDFVGTPFVIDFTGAGFSTTPEWYSKITSSGFKAQTSNTVYSEVTNNNGFATQSGVGQQVAVRPSGVLTSTVGSNTDITLSMNNGARGTYSFPDLGDFSTADVIVTQTTQTVKQAKVTIDPLDFRSISSNPIEIVSAEGEGTVINIISATAFLDYNSAAFNFTGEIYLRVGNNPSWSMENTDINVVADNYISFKAPTQTSSSVSNSPVVITSGSDSLGGDSNVTIIVTYTVDDYN